MNNKINHLCFDIDGVLSQTRTLHYIALNDALTHFGCPAITEEEHKTTYDGLSTRQKLEILTKKHKLNKKFHNEIFDYKQNRTFELLNKELKNSPGLIVTLELLKDAGNKLSVATNCIKKTTDLILEKLGVIKMFDYIVTNEDVCNAKPSPEGLLKCMANLESKPSNTLYIGDLYSDEILAGAAGCHFLRINSEKDLTFEKITNKIRNLR